MTYRIVLPVDGSPYARWAGEFVWRHLAAGDAPTRVSLLHVSTPVPAADARDAEPGAVERFHAGEAERMLAPLRKMLDAHSVRFDANARIGNAGLEIARQAREDGAALIVMGSRGVGALHELAFGSTLQRVLAETTLPIIAVRKPPSRRTFRRAMLAVDGSATSMRAVKAFLQLRGLFGALHVDLVHVARPVSLREALAFNLGSRDDHYARGSWKAMQPARAALARAGLEAETFSSVGDVADSIASLAAERQSDLVVMGSHGRGGARRLVMGSVSRNVLATTEVPVMMVQ
jgi:nucleotide-binding universal stress UspA family protein